MKFKLKVCGFLFSTFILFGCGGGGGGGGSSGGATATNDSLSSIPSVDLSNYDKSSSTNANIALLTKSASLLGKSVGGLVSKGIGQNLNAEGKSSRAGCEANMHKKEIIRHSLSAQLDRCYPEAMESVGLITIPTGSYAIYSITPPDEGDEARGNMCDDIPEQDTQRRQACESGEGSHAGGEMRLRIGKFGSDLHVDLCEANGLIDEATYGVSGSTYSAAVTRIGTWGGAAESSTFGLTVDIGASGSVANGIATIGTDGSVSAAGQMSGGFGSGRETFEFLPADNSNRVSGAFGGSFTDPFTQTASSFTGRVYSRFGGSTATGCAKFSFTGSMPPMRVADMVPFGIGQADLDGFLQSFGADLGITLNASNYQSVYLCENPNFDRDNQSATVKALIPLTEGETCASVTHTGVECFGITNITQQGDLANDVRQTYTIIASASSPYFEEVNAYDVSALDLSINTIAFSRSWDCTGTATTVDFSGISEVAMMAAMQECFALEERAYSNDGMGGYNCGGQEHQNGINDFAGEGGPDFGTFGGDLTAAVGGDCSQNQAPQRLFINALNTDTNQYCLPAEGSCSSFTVSGTTGTPDDTIQLGGGLTVNTVNSLEFNDATNPTQVTVSYGTPLSCDQPYAISQPSFNGPAEFGGNDIPAACIDPVTQQPVTEQSCHQICSDPQVDCSV